MTGNFNIHDSLWDLMYPFYSSHSDIIFDVVDAFDLNLSIPTNHVPTRYTDNECNSNSVIDFMFLKHRSEKFDNHHIYPD